MTLKLAPNLTLPPELAHQAIVLVGLRGSGKTNTAGVIVEELLREQQALVVIDPTDVWWGLRSSADGSKPGFPVLVIGGEHGQLPLDEADGKTIAQFLVEERAPTILSIRHLRKAAQRRFVKDLAEELYHLKGRQQYRQPLTVVIDEAPLFIPQDVRGDAAGVVGSIEDLVARGRAAGFGIIIISQRFATINKNVSTQADTIIAHRLPSPQDRKALKDWIEENATLAEQSAVLSSLATLADGEAWVWSPRQSIFERVQIRLKNTFDSSKTPGRGEAARAPRKEAEVDLESLKGKLAASIEKARADNPVELRRQIAELKKQLAKPAVDAGAQDRERQFRAQVAEQEALIEALQERMRKAGVLLHFQNLNKAELKPRNNYGHNNASEIKAVPAPGKRREPIAVTPRPTTTISPGESGALAKAERAILTAFYFLKDEEATPQKVAFYSNYSAGTSTMNNALGRLRHGLLAGWRITAEGVALVESWGVQPKPAGSELLELLRAKLGRAEWALLQALVDVHPRRLTGEELAAGSGYSLGTSTFSNAIGKLRTIGAAEGFAKDGGTKAADVFFE